MLESALFWQGLLGFQQALPSLYMPKNQPTFFFFLKLVFCPLPTLSPSLLSLFSHLPYRKLFFFSSKRLILLFFSSPDPFSLWIQSPQRGQESPLHFQSSSSRVSPPRISKISSSLSLKCLLHKQPPSVSAPLHYSSPLALESPTISLKTPAYSTPHSSHEVGNYPS